MKNFKSYIKIARPDHWIKNFFIVPGVLFAMLLVYQDRTHLQIFLYGLLGFFSTCMIASANYVINEWLDAKYDRFHPTKKDRAAVLNKLNPWIIAVEYIILAGIGLTCAYFVSIPFLITAAVLLFMGLVYNIPPVRTKDLPYLDVLSESINNALRLLLGWFIVTDKYFPPITIVIGFWLGGAFLMAIKRFAEYRMIADKSVASAYRKSFKYYTEKSLLISSIFYALASSAFVGIFIIKYKIEMVLCLPIMWAIFCYYLSLAFKEDSAVQKPEKLYKEKWLLLMCLILAIVFVVSVFVEIPFLHVFVDSVLVEL